MITLLTLNLWGYKDWDNRLNNIADFINQIDADVIALQEVQQDDSFSKISQSETLAERANYKFQVYVPVCKKPSVSGRNSSTSHGLAILSKFEITNVRSLLLDKYLPEHEQCAALYAQIKLASQDISICNVHFHNTDETSLLHLNEVTNFFKKQKLQPIMLGDFNIYELSKHKDLLSNYTMSTDHKKYDSFVEDGGTLDYIVAPSDQYAITEIGTSESYVSDHRAVWAQIKPIKDKHAQT